MERSGELPLNELPEGCIANALSFTTPLDVARLAAVSPMFKSAAISNVVWERFLPSDVEHILSTSPDGSLLLESFPPRTYGFDNQPVDVTMRLDEGEIGARTVSWNPQGRRRHINGSVTVRGSVHYPKERGDGWLETELGDFSVEGEDGELEMRLFDDTRHWKRRFILDGIEIRPKDVSRAAS